MPGFEDMVEAHGLHLLRLASGLTGDEAEARELLRRSLSRVARSWRRLAETNRPEAQARRLLVSEYLSLRSRTGRVLARRAVRYRRTGSARRGPVDSPQPRVEPAYAPFQRLHERQWVVLVLRYGQNLGDQEVADALGCPASDVVSTCERALGRLRQHGFGTPSGTAATPGQPIEEALRSALRDRQSTAHAATVRQVAATVTQQLREPRQRHLLPWVAAGAVAGLAVLGVTGPRWVESAVVSPPDSRASVGTAAPVEPAFAARGWYVLSRFRAARNETAPPRLVISGPVWEASSPKDAGTVAKLLRGRLRDEVPPIDDRAAVGTVRFPDGAEALTPVLGRHETLAELAKEIPACRGCSPVVAAEGKLTSMKVRTPMGQATVPAQEYRIKGTHVRVRRIAIPDSSLVVLPPLTGGADLAPVTAVTSRVVTSGPGDVLNVTFAPRPVTSEGDAHSCQTYRAVVVESEDGVAIGVLPVRRAVTSGGLPALCTGRQQRTAKVRLTRPLAERMVLDGATGKPVTLAYR